MMCPQLNSSSPPPRCSSSVSSPCPTPHHPSPIIGSETWQSLTPLCISITTPPITKFCPFDLPNNSHTIHFPPSALPCPSLLRPCNQLLLSLCCFPASGLKPLQVILYAAVKAIFPKRRSNLSLPYSVSFGDSSFPAESSTNFLA